MSINQKDIFKHFSSSQEVAGEHFFSRSFSVFMKVMEEKKFSAAAVKLQLTQSSISQTIAGLERSLGVDLFNRESRPPQPTKEAVKLYEALKESEKNVSQILVNIQYENLVKPAVRIGMIESAGKVIAADLCKQMQKTLGLVSLTSEPSGTLMEQLKEGSLDIAVLAGEESHEDINKYFLGEDPWYFIFPKEFTLNQEKLTFEKLKLCGLPFIYHSKETADGGLLNEYFRKHNLYFPKVFEIQSNAFVYDLVGAGLGWSVSHMLGLMSHEKNTLNICPISDASGTMIAHSGGVVLSPESGSTMALIEAKDAAGAMLPGSPGTRVDSNGYAILPYLRPYRINAVEIDPKGSHDDVAFDRTVAQVVPWEGSVVKVAFGTKVQNNLTLQARQANHEPLPFAASIFSPDGKEIGVVGQGSMMFISDANAKRAIVKWSGGQCSVDLGQQTTKDSVCR